MGFCSIVLYRVSLDRTIVQGPTWYVWRVIWGPLSECSFASVCLSVFL